MVFELTFRKLLPVVPLQSHAHSHTDTIYGLVYHNPVTLLQVPLPTKCKRLQ